ncbi:DNA-binding response regulator, OmpR family, contains REC and winged-helix (wHTH) domain [Dyella sp. OK004]|uniref:response regulator n=1 Tax=Dyella sp. OK004 TaxID=1855292 RepID=UPI0008ED1094|nr:response regulator transcription factor [Dyella sp. OK004]SFS13972.1 DNA-binding response regulator, OmpR family, contains REC and winged-helix (wHTH) domain [Dyella sp. OK004]
MSVESFEPANGSRPTRLLVVEDDPEISTLVNRYLTSQGFEVMVAANGAMLRNTLAATAVDLVLLDLGLPGEDGFALTRYLHEHWQGPVIIVSGRGESVDRVVGLELGADDYVTKPFELRELLARIRSVLRRSAGRPPPKTPSGEGSPALHFAGYQLDPGSRLLTGPEGQEISLTTGEFDLLQLFLEHPNRVLSRNDIMTHIHGRDAGPFDRAIDVQISRLRRKIDADPTRPALFKSIRGAGYMFTERVKRA